MNFLILKLEKPAKMQDFAAFTVITVDFVMKYYWFNCSNYCRYDAKGAAKLCLKHYFQG